MQNVLGFTSKQLSTSTEHWYWIIYRYENITSVNGSVMRYNCAKYAFNSIDFFCIDLFGALHKHLTLNFVDKSSFSHRARRNDLLIFLILQVWVTVTRMIYAKRMTWINANKGGINKFSGIFTTDRQRHNVCF